jgi:hypothetical protein
MSSRTAAVEQVLSAALRVLQSERTPPHAHSGDEAEYAEEQLMLAARELTRATDSLDLDEQPVGWRDMPKHDEIGESSLKQAAARADVDHNAHITLARVQRVRLDEDLPDGSDSTTEEVTLVLIRPDTMVELGQVTELLTVGTTIDPWVRMT